MKISLSTRSESELSELMLKLGHTSPRHTIQCLITQALKSNNHPVEENKSYEHSTNH